MKKKVILISFLLITLILTACSADNILDPIKIPTIPPVYPKGDGTATLTWDAVTTNNEGNPVSGEVRYRIYFGNESGKHPWTIDIGIGEVVDNRVSYTIKNLAKDIEYFFVVRAYASGGESTNSNEVSKLVE